MIRIHHIAFRETREVGHLDGNLSVIAYAHRHLLQDADVIGNLGMRIDIPTLLLTLIHIKVRGHNAIFNQEMDVLTDLQVLETIILIYRSATHIRGDAETIFKTQIKDNNRGIALVISMKHLVRMTYKQS